ncbi:hypothetical protein BDF20DRAFT_829714 [Mycotypha africana]|uniref:uncharacterized protein n=1 Tax=Mycotypha africana TaxID=64632 RepID=UPI0022FFCEDC|nr:uncharacterized protein BDF20DRAFT_829714 [Mycotypha africana]KAI8967354.1 hypothetical protein BDF20DRAFT_829714 [Mycotypha africana]
MAKDRSAISKNMGSKKRVSGTHVSGLSTAKASSKRKEAPMKYGQLSRRQKQDFEDYGELVPRDFIDDDEENYKRRRVVSEADLDREIDEARREAAAQFASDEEGEQGSDEDEDEGEDWKKPSAYSLLMGSLKKNSKHRDFYEKIYREQEGIEDEVFATNEEDEDRDLTEEVPSDEEEGEMEEDEKVESVVDDDEVAELSRNPEDAEDADAADPFEEDDEEEIVYVGSDAEEDEDENNIADLFETRYCDDQPVTFDERISSIEQKKYTTQVFEDEVLTDVVAMIPSSTATAAADKKISDMPIINNLADVRVKKRPVENWPKANKDVVKKGKGTFSPLQNCLFNQLNNYRDIVYCNRSMHNAKEIRNAYVLHAVNHVMKTRDRIMKNNAKLAKAQKEGQDIGETRDQGFTRPKVLILLPFRNTVLDVVDTIIKLSGTVKQDNINRFLEQFNLREDEAIDPTKPADFLQNFQGNIDDHFRLGIKFSKKSLKLYADFYNSDILICSPLGLRTLIGAEGDKKRDFDFLSSIEVLILDQTNHFLMQNWEHIEHIFQHLNLIPKDSHGCDISRIKSWYLDGKAKYLRQTLLFSDFLTPEINASYNKHFKNIAGKLKIKQKVEDGSIVDVIPQVQQSFTRIDVSTLAAVNDARYKHFIEKTLPTLRKSAIMQSHTLIFIPSYFDFVRVRNYFEDNKYSYEPCSEYASGSQITRSRSKFFHGRSDFLLYTERLHFFRR